MKTTKRFLLAAISIALAFTFSCSDDKDNSTSPPSVGDACKYSNGVCEETSGENLKAWANSRNLSVSTLKEQLKKECEEMENGTSYDSCPSGYVSKCERENKSSVYFYSDEFKDIDCEKYFDSL